MPTSSDVATALASYDMLTLRELVPGLENLAIGQDVMRIFSLIDFIPNQELTIRVKAGTHAFRVFGDVVCSYLVVAKSENTSRLLVKLIALSTRSKRLVHSV